MIVFIDSKIHNIGPNEDEHDRHLIFDELDEIKVTNVDFEESVD